MSDSPLLSVESVTKQFGSLKAVNGVDLSLPAGEHHSVIGPNGAGKTTLFNLISGVIQPTTGRIVFQGRDITHLREDERARLGIIRSFQLTQLFYDLSIRDNLRLALQSKSQEFNPLTRRETVVDEEADRWLDVIGIDLDPVTPAKSLPHGDKKRLEIVMALAADPSLLLLDEPTSGVSAEETREVVDRVTEFTADITVLMIEHNVELALGFADRVTVMDRGSVVAQGPPEEIAADSSVREVYLGVHDGAP